MACLSVSVNSLCAYKHVHTNINTHACTNMIIQVAMGMKEPLLPEPCAPELLDDGAASAPNIEAGARPPAFNPAGEPDDDDDTQTVPLAQTSGSAGSR